MGNRQNVPRIPDDVMDDYIALTYLPKTEIVYILKSFYELGPNYMKHNFHHRFHKSELFEKYPFLEHNPFRDRIIATFSSMEDDCMSFEDMLDMCSAMSEYCPHHVKAIWAFRLFDLDDDGQISVYDIGDIIDWITYDKTDPNKFINNADKMKIARTLLNEMDVQCVGSLGPAEFVHLVSKIPEFRSSFYFRI